MVRGGNARMRNVKMKGHEIANTFEENEVKIHIHLCINRSSAIMLQPEIES